MCMCMQPLQVALQPFIVCDMDEVLLYNADKDDVIKTIFDEAKQYVEREIRDSLADYRSKSLLGELCCAVISELG